MKPINFPNANIVFAVDQDEYQPLPAHKSAAGAVTSCWSLTLRERLKILRTGRVYLKLLTFGSPLQPQLLSADDLSKP